MFYLLCFSTFVGCDFVTFWSGTLEDSAVVKPGDIVPIDYCTLSKVPTSWDNVKIVIEGPGRGRIFSQVPAHMADFPVVRLPNNVIVTTDERMVEMIRVLEQSDGFIDTKHPAIIARLQEWESLEHRPGGVFGDDDPVREGVPRRSPYFWPVVALTFVGTFLLVMWWDGDIRLFPKKA